MTRSAEATRSKIIASAYRLIRRHGFARVRMDDIAAGAKVTKRTLYHHYDSKDSLIAAMLAAQSELATAAFVRIVDRSDHDPEGLVDTLFRDLATWTTSKNWEGSGFTRLAVELADLPGHPARRMARQHKSGLETYLAERLASVELAGATAFAREISLLLEGAMVMVLIHGDRSYVEAAAGAAETLLRSRIHSVAGRDADGA